MIHDANVPRCVVPHGRIITYFSKDVIGGVKGIPRGDHAGEPGLNFLILFPYAIFAL
jgi:hypothetical protein